ncbi:MAG TPA: FAD:protein FMN transferase [Rudaea sp.]|nr:FAD:protein FMN transferase [Rudaea sp.]
MSGITEFRRARPWLGTLVELRVEGLDATRAARACERAFAEVACVHRLMTLHDSGGDLDRLHRARPGTPVRVDMRTREVIDWALRVAAASDGCFDPTVAARQVARGLLPRPASPWSPDRAATWRDIELIGARGIRLARPLWIDLGGIAKGYAVDRAVAILVAAGAAQVCVNAGGDLRVAGTRSEVVNLRTQAGVEAVPALEIGDAALATSAGPLASVDGEDSPVHLHGRTRRPTGDGCVASVVATECVVADALTKVVMCGDDDVARRALERFGAQAWVLKCGRTSSLLEAAA